MPLKRNELVFESTVKQTFILHKIMEQVDEFCQCTAKGHGESWTPVASFIRMVKIRHNDLECTVLVEGEQTRWLKITTGVWKGCIHVRVPVVAWGWLHDFKNNRSPKKWLKTTLKDFDFSDSIVFASLKYRARLAGRICRKSGTEAEWWKLESDESEWTERR